MNSKPLVSICCAAYNHEPYIRDALEGFVMQKTDFLFEVIINDDASTDKTAEIIKEYETKYPDIIKPNYQVENKYSKGIRPSTITFKLAKGKYVALCEGDDYWTDSLKLQKQVDEMEKHPECDMSFHPALVIYDDGSKKNEYRTYLKTGNKIIPPEEIIRNGGGFCPTASLMFRKEVLSDLPEWFNDAPVGDQFLQIHGALRGGAVYIDEPMSVYRRMVNKSWSDNMKNLKYALSHNNKRVRYLERFNKDLNYKYNDEFKYQISFWLWDSAWRSLSENKHSDFKKYIMQSWNIYAKISTKQAILFYCRNIPFLNLPVKAMTLVKSIK
ncbi:glycosyltransferase [Methanosalsum natronophilum]|uniref:glycosyltransferase n=1 Tax=Methanosalsum natronophilum TaxID=768733 RepID=UPI002168E5F3|nr:glycosyltransferase [Methanosalsum natronophilum]MCS3924891.1 glycosyltransferase involved in cell wall biosynthesis [Methanosalsum natronophilum]